MRPEGACARASVLKALRPCSSRVLLRTDHLLYWYKSTNFDTVGAEGAAPVQQPRVAAHGLVSACFAERRLVSRRLLYVYVTH
jgi:hypothetical protein